MNIFNVLTYGVNYEYYVYERFIGSLKKTGFKGNIHIIIGKNDINHIIHLQKLYDNIFYFVDELNKNTHINNHRFFVIEQYIQKNNIQDDSYIFFCDMRDVLFQKNIEKYTLDNNIDLYGFLEGIKIKQDTVCNSVWIKELECIMNEDIYNKISDNYVVCCGTTLAKASAFKNSINRLPIAMGKDAYGDVTCIDLAFKKKLIYISF